jgi:tRNA (cmo5U34)-methyltransferase
MAVKRRSGFDWLAPVYDQLVSLVFGKSMRKAQIHFLDHIQPNTKVLIVGGGTGWLLEEISKRNITCEIWYVELSDKMMELSKARMVNNNIHFIRGTEEDIPAGIQYDVVITNFYLDLFPNARLPEVILRLDHITHSSTHWIVTDFEKQKWWHTVMLKIMYVFFRLTCNIEASRLPDWRLDLNGLGWKENKSAWRYGNFIRTTLWVK